MPHDRYFQLFPLLTNYHNPLRLDLLIKCYYASRKEFQKIAMAIRLSIVILLLICYRDHSV